MKNHLKLLTIEQIREFNKKYIFELTDKFVVVRNRDYKRVTYHDSDKPFSINSKIRKITFWKETIDIWRELLKDYPVTLIEVQNVVSKCYLMYQPVTCENVIPLLNKQSCELLKGEKL